MPRGRKPQASAVNKKNGTYIKNPQRENKHEPIAPEGWPEKPAVIIGDAHAEECWERTCQLLDRMKILSKADGALLLAYCTTYADFIELREQVRTIGRVIISAGDDGPMIKRNQLYTEMQKARVDMLKQLSELGLTPSSRSRLVAESGLEAEGGLDEWFKRYGGLN